MLWNSMVGLVSHESGTFARMAGVACRGVTERFRQSCSLRSQENLLRTPDYGTALTMSFFLSYIFFFIARELYTIHHESCIPGFALIGDPD
jgi:hypothetical protein